MSMQCMLIELYPDKVDEYKDVHLKIWPEIYTKCKSLGVKQERLYLQDNLGVLFIEADDLDYFFREFMESEIGRKWDELTSPMVKSRSGYLEKIYDQDDADE